jgi:hypothetical protein
VLTPDGVETTETIVGGTEAGVVTVWVEPPGVVTVKVFGAGMYSVATEPLGVTTWTDGTEDGMASVVVPPDGVKTDEMTVGTEVGTAVVAPDGVTMVTLLGAGTDEMTGTEADWYETVVVAPDGVVMVSTTVGAVEAGVVMVSVAPDGVVTT